MKKRYRYKNRIGAGWDSGLILHQRDCQRVQYIIDRANITRPVFVDSETDKDETKTSYTFNEFEEIELCGFGVVTQIAKGETLDECFANAREQYKQWGKWK